jgi:hypothetical protein
MSSMRVMCSNHSSTKFLALIKEHPTRLGWLLGPISYKRPRLEVPFALDNDTLWRKGLPFNPDKWINMLEKVKVSGIDPLWIAVPDVVADRVATLKNWQKYSQIAAEYGWPLCFVVQNGMTAKDIPSDAQVIFVGGTTGWKWATVHIWCKSFPRVHVGRVNGLEKLYRCQQLGAESVDGSGWFRATFGGRESRKLQAWIHHESNPQYEFPQNVLL